MPGPVRRPDLVLLGLMLPGIDGFEVCRRVRATGPVPIIMLAARGADIDVVGGLEAGADDYVVKPVQPGVLDARFNVRPTGPVTAGDPPVGAAPGPVLFFLRNGKPAPVVRQTGHLGTVPDAVVLLRKGPVAPPCCPWPLRAPRWAHWRRGS